jgi:hypothetical protein
MLHVHVLMHLTRVARKAIYLERNDAFRYANAMNF